MHLSTLDVYHYFFLFGSLIPADVFDVVVIVGGLSVGQVPVGVVRELCKSTKPGNTHFLYHLNSHCYIISFNVSMRVRMCV